MKLALGNQLALSFPDTLISDSEDSEASNTVQVFLSIGIWTASEFKTEIETYLVLHFLHRLVECLDVLKGKTELESTAFSNPSFLLVISADGMGHFEFQGEVKDSDCESRFTFKISTDQSYLSGWSKQIEAYLKRQKDLK
jgi:hypothetical protein